MPSSLDKRKWRPEDSDGCTMWPDGDWHRCCLDHDEEYFYGGTWRDRIGANWNLTKCVAKSGGKRSGRIRSACSIAGHYIMAPVMFVGTQIFGCFLWPYNLQWGKMNEEDSPSR